MSLSLKETLLTMREYHSRSFQQTEAYTDLEEYAYETIECEPPGADGIVSPEAGS